MNPTTLTALAAATVALGIGTASAQTLSIGSNPQGSLAYSTAAGIAKVATEATDLKVRVIPQGGPVVTLPLLNNGELDFTISLSIPAAFSTQGRAMFKKSGKQANVRVCCGIVPVASRVLRPQRFGHQENIRSQRQAPRVQIPQTTGNRADRCGHARDRGADL
jgi:uncharacterized protein